MECHSKWNVTQNGTLLIWNVPKNLMSLKVDYHIKNNVIKNGVLLKIQCQSKDNLTKKGMS